MSNQTISSIPQAVKSPAKGAELSGEPSSAKLNGSSPQGAQDSFGSVLARQIDEMKGVPAETAATGVIAAGIKGKAAELLSSQTEKDKIASTDVTALAGLFFVHPEIRLPLDKPVIGKAVANAGVAEVAAVASTGVAVAWVTGAKLDGARIEGAKVEGAGVTGAKITTAGVTGSDVTPAKITATTNDTKLIEQAGKSEKTTIGTQIKPDAVHTSLPGLATAQQTDHTSPIKANELSNATASAATHATLNAFSVQPGTVPNNQLTLSAPLGSNAWPQEFSQKVSWISTQQMQSAELHLNPPDLGPIHIVLTVSDNQATALFSSPHSAVREAMENALPKLREIMADNGIMLGNATVSDQSPRDSSGFMNQRTRTDATLSDRIAADLTATSVPVMAARHHNGMVDTFA